MFQQDPRAVGGSLALSALCAAIPLVVLFVLLGGLKVRAWLSGVIALLVSLVIAIALFGMPVGQGISAAILGALFGFFPILWIVINAVWVYNLTVVSGHFDVLRRSFEKVSPDQRIQAIIIAFCFGALLEALAGFGTPVAITVVMLVSLGFKPVKAATVALLANTAPVAFGALAIPITTLAGIASGVNNDPRLTVDGIGSMVGRQTPLLAIVVPLFLVIVVDGVRGARQTWPAALLAGVVFGLGQYLSANFISVPLADIIASLAAAASLVLLVRVWQPAEVLRAEPDEETTAIATRAARPGGTARGTTTVAATGGPDRGAPGTGDQGTGAAGAGTVPADSRGEVFRAYAPYLVVIAIFAIMNIPALVEFFGKAPWTYIYNWPGLHVLNSAGDPVATTFKLNWLPAAGTLLVIAGLITMAILKVSPAKALRTYIGTYVELRSAIITVMAVLALAYVLNDSGMTASMGVWLAGTGAAFAVLSPILGWIGVAVTGSDTSSNALFGALQAQTAAKAGLDPLLMVSANSSGGVLGKMISPQNLAIAAAAVGMAGREGEIFRKVIGWSVLLLVVMCAIVGLQSTPVLGWMVP